MTTASVDLTATETAPEDEWWRDRPIWTVGGPRVVSHCTSGVLTDVRGTNHAAHSVTPLLKAGERSSDGWWVIELLTMTGDELMVLVFKAGEVKEETITLGALDWARATPESTEEVLPNGAAGAIAVMHQRTKEWKVRATAIAHRLGNDNDMCEVLDNALIEMGLDPRPSDVEVKLSWEGEHTTFVNFRNFGFVRPDDLLNASRVELHEVLLSEMGLDNGATAHDVIEALTHYIGIEEV